MTVRQSSFINILTFESKVISRIYSEIAQQLAVLETVKAVLPAALAGHIVHCVISKQKLSVYTDSANWASQLRFYNNDFCEAVKVAGFSSIHSADIKIFLKHDSLQVNKIHATAPPSAQTIAHLRQQSFLCTDPQLRQSLNKLSATLESLHAKSARITNYRTSRVL